MKKLILTLCILLFSAFPAFGATADIYIQKLQETTAGIKVVIYCGGGDGAIPDTSTDDLMWKGKSLTSYLLHDDYETYFEQVCMSPGTTAPDAASLFLKMETDGNDVVDLLGSEDDCATAYAGLNLLHASKGLCALGDMYIVRAGEHLSWLWHITNSITIDVDDQGTSAAEWTITLSFLKVY